MTWEEGAVLLTLAVLVMRFMWITPQRVGKVRFWVEGTLIILVYVFLILALRFAFPKMAAEFWQGREQWEWVRGSRDF